jgi:hypothetical protein
VPRVGATAAGVFVVETDGLGRRVQGAARQMGQEHHAVLQQVQHEAQADIQRRGKGEKNEQRSHEGILRRRWSSDQPRGTGRLVGMTGRPALFRWALAK